MRISCIVSWVCVITYVQSRTAIIPTPSYDAWSSPSDLLGTRYLTLPPPAKPVGQVGSRTFVKVAKNEDWPDMVGARGMTVLQIGAEHVNQAAYTVSMREVVEKEKRAKMARRDRAGHYVPDVDV